DHIAQQLRDGAASTYTEIVGRADLRAALAADLTTRYGAALDADDVMITAGCNQAFCAAIDAIAGAGDNVILPVPYYFNHDMWLQIRSVEARYLTVDRATGMVPDPAALDALIDGRTRAIMLVTPNNPSGAIAPPETIAHFYRIAQKHGIALILDETYRDYAPADASPHALFSDPDWRDTVVHLYSFSKAYSLTGYRVGALACGGAIRDNAIKIQDCVQICAPHIGQLAALYALQNLQAWKQAAADAMAARGDAFRAAFAAADTGFTLESVGAYFAYVRHPFAAPAEAVAARLARDHGIVTLPGTFFGPGQEQHLRLAMSNVTEARLPELVDRLQTATATGSQTAA
ncbi:MAG: aminotransferase, partial [Pseudomonadota bacterium]